MRKATEEKLLKVYQPNLQVVRLDLVGDAPGYIGNGWTPEAIKELEDSLGPRKPDVKKARDYNAEFNGTRRLLTVPVDGATDGIPSSAFMDAMVKAGFRCADFVQTNLRAWLSIDSAEGLLPIFGSVAEPRRDMCRVKKGQGSTIPFPVCRPFYRAPWSTTLQLKYDANSIALEQVYSLVVMAGFSIGVGAWRPEKKGDFGRFTVAGGTEVAQ